jgi:DNA-3-methyladenine glycosylase
MFGPPGHFYVYLSHGLHFCANLVCEPAGTGAAVLLRAVEPLAGEERMRGLRAGRLRAARTRRELTNGPGKLAQAFAITLADDGASALRGALRIEARSDSKAGPDARELAIETSPRIGLGKGVDLPYRFFLPGNRWVSRRAGRAR